jgi:hypothetical protein
MPDHNVCENWAYWGIAENVGGARSVLVVNGSNIDRVAVPSGTVTTVSSFGDLSDMCSIAVSPTTGRWYYHHEGDSELGPSNEALGYCDVTIAP